MKYRRIKYFSILLLSGTLLFAGSDETGGYAGAFLRMPLSARSAALGNAAGSLKDSPESFVENPAVLSSLEKREFGSSFQFLSLDRSLHMVSLAMPLPPSAGLALAWVHAGVGKIEERNFSNVLTGELQTSQDALYIGFSNMIWESFTIGINAKVLIDQLPEVTATGFGLDLGFYYRPFDDINLGLTFKDINSKINWNTNNIYTYGSQRSDAYPRMIQFSGDYDYKDFLLLTIAYKGSYDIRPTWHGGLEVKAGKHIALRTGLDDMMPVFGLSTHYDVWEGIDTRIDYAFLLGRYSEGYSHVFSWIFSF
ncbi:MAG TPA: hypothetical protein ENO01_02700 [Candidatus Marinimicrobia bacterium]|nr:hypothetical protein [Candidatus Neomarinimicrobiota bacterium]